MKDESIKTNLQKAVQNESDAWKAEQKAALDPFLVPIQQKGWYYTYAKDDDYKYTYSGTFCFKNSYSECIHYTLHGFNFYHCQFTGCSSLDAIEVDPIEVEDPINVGDCSCSYSYWRNYDLYPGEPGVFAADVAVVESNGHYTHYVGSKVNQVGCSFKQYPIPMDCCGQYVYGTVTVCGGHCIGTHTNAVCNCETY